MNDGTLSVRDCGFSYGKKEVFRGVTFSVEPGTLCGLFGPNGSGKSTLFKCCLNLLKPREGSIYTGGTDVSRLSAGELARRAAYVPQEHNPPFPFLVRDMVLMGRVAHSSGLFGVRPRDRNAAEEAMERLGIRELAEEPCTRLSGGQRQLVLIARAIAQDTPLVLLDEPTSSLDFRNQLLIWRILRDLAGSGKAVLACVHDPNHVVWFCDRAAVMHSRGLAAWGPPETVMVPELLRRLYGPGCAVGNMAGKPMVYPQ
ncbi:ABC transporter ATP-binding protein [Breznakiella homolactica]|uniref:ABC transporter ATP-binding protein n=1 Tax=Breznakiella homolactica TaxID=2798577 RepID=A0A7T8B9A7_9SPIR|nr:ABC transporter ATP-binding protein [Breznakiella homolactica]QQO07760.1 ABC transporter ATP-binding protein [Breznakiella homolactica]